MTTEVVTAEDLKCLDKWGAAPLHSDLELWIYPIQAVHAHEKASWFTGTSPPTGNKKAARQRRAALRVSCVQTQVLAGSDGRSHASGYCRACTLTC